MKSRLGIIWVLAILIIFVLSACSGPKIRLLPDPRAPLQEQSLSGSGDDKILVVPVMGVIDSRPSHGLFLERPSVVEEVVASLDRAKRDDSVKAVLLRIDSPGGSATGSDILNHEIRRFKEETGKPVVAHMMGMSTSGGYYTAVAADAIIAHPTSVTGSIGVIFYTANIEGLFDKIGVKAEPVKSGKHKDIASPFRGMDEEERAILQSMIDEMFGRFIAAIDKGRPMLDETKIRELADGRIYTAKQALDAQLIDQIGYTEEAIKKAKTLAGLTGDARLIIYRRDPPAKDDNIYNTSVKGGGDVSSLVSLGFNRFRFIPKTGFYYVWEPGLVK